MMYNVCNSYPFWDAGVINAEDGVILETAVPFKKGLKYRKKQEVIFGKNPITGENEYIKKIISCAGVAKVSITKGLPPEPKLKKKKAANIIWVKPGVIMRSAEEEPGEVSVSQVKTNSKRIQTARFLFPIAFDKQYQPSQHTLDKMMPCIPSTTHEVIISGNSKSRAVQTEPYCRENTEFIQNSLTELQNDVETQFNSKIIIPDDKSTYNMMYEETLAQDGIKKISLTPITKRKLKTEADKRKHLISKYPGFFSKSEKMKTSTEVAADLILKRYRTINPKPEYEKITAQKKCKDDTSPKDYTISSPIVDKVSLEVADMTNVNPTTASNLLTSVQNPSHIKTTIKSNANHPAIALTNQHQLTNKITQASQAAQKIKIHAPPAQQQVPDLSKIYGNLITDQKQLVPLQNNTSATQPGGNQQYKTYIYTPGPNGSQNLTFIGNHPYNISTTPTPKIATSSEGTSLLKQSNPRAIPSQLLSTSLPPLELHKQILNIIPDPAVSRPKTSQHHVMTPIRPGTATYITQPNQSPVYVHPNPGQSSLMIQPAGKPHENAIPLYPILPGQSSSKPLSIHTTGKLIEKPLLVQSSSNIVSQQQILFQSGKSSEKPFYIQTGGKPGGQQPIFYQHTMKPAQQPIAIQPLVKPGAQKINQSLSTQQLCMQSTGKPGGQTFVIYPSGIHGKKPIMNGNYEIRPSLPDNQHSSIKSKLVNIAPAMAPKASETQSIIKDAQKLIPVPTNNVYNFLDRLTQLNNEIGIQITNVLSKSNSDDNKNELSKTSAKNDSVNPVNLFPIGNPKTNHLNQVLASALKNKYVLVDDILKTSPKDIIKSKPGTKKQLPNEDLRDTSVAETATQKSLKGSDNTTTASIKNKSTTNEDLLIDTLSPKMNNSKGTIVKTDGCTLMTSKDLQNDEISSESKNGKQSQMDTNKVTSTALEVKIEIETDVDIEDTSTTHDNLLTDAVSFEAKNEKDPHINIKDPTVTSTRRENDIESIHGHKDLSIDTVAKNENNKETKKETNNKLFTNTDTEYTPYATQQKMEATKEQFSTISNLLTSPSMIATLQLQPNLSTAILKIQSTSKPEKASNKDDLINTLPLLTSDLSPKNTAINYADFDVDFSLDLTDDDVHVIEEPRICQNLTMATKTGDSKVKSVPLETSTKVQPTQSETSTKVNSTPLENLINVQSTAAETPTKVKPLPSKTSTEIQPTAAETPTKGKPESETSTKMQPTPVETFSAPVKTTKKMPLLRTSSKKIADETKTINVVDIPDVIEFEYKAWDIPKEIDESLKSFSISNDPKEDRKYKCGQCFKSFRKESGVIFHLRSIHYGWYPYTCPLCDKGYIDRRDVYKHMDSHLGIKQYPCKTCEQSFINEKERDKHNKMHYYERRYQCDICGVRFGRKGALISHQLIHNTKKEFSCQYCARTFTFVYDWRNHLRIHTGERPHKCDYCNKSFRRKEHLNHHLFVHTGKSIYQCKVCQKYFQTRKNMNVHIRQVHPDPEILKDKYNYFCKVCFAIFENEQYLDRHERNKHLVELKKRVFCRLCHLPCETWADKRRHEYKYHGSITENTNLPKTVKEIEGSDPTESTNETLKEFQCVLCDRILSNNETVTKHYETHSKTIGEMEKEIEHVEIIDNASQLKYKCSYCNFGFKEYQDLFKHETRHKTYPQGLNDCHDCAITFKFPAMLVKHIHSGHTSMKGSINNMKPIHAEDDNEANDNDNPNKRVCEECDFVYKKGHNLGDIEWHMASCHGGPNHRFFTCHLCDKLLRSERELQKHNFTAHTIYDCPYCLIRVQVRSHARLLKHFNDFHTCIDCKTIYKITEDVRLHVRIMHHEEKPKSLFLCSMCSEDCAFIVKVELEGHLTLKHKIKEELIDASCYKVISDDDKIQTIITNILNKSFIIPDDVLKKPELPEFEKKTRVKYYPRTKPNKPRTPIDEATKAQRALQRLAEKEKDLPYGCPRCTRRYDSMLKISRHRKEKHNLCPHCEYESPDRIELQQHMATHKKAKNDDNKDENDDHTEDEETNPKKKKRKIQDDVIEGTPGEKKKKKKKSSENEEPVGSKNKFKCKICTKFFPTLDHVRRHIPIHFKTIDTQVLETDE